MRSIVIIAIVTLLTLTSCLKISPSQEDSTQETTLTFEEYQTESPAEECAPNWECSEWTQCGVGRVQKRTCVDSNECVTGQMTELQDCRLTLQEIKELAITPTYDDLLRDNDKYELRIVNYRGEVAQVTEIASDEYILRVLVTKNEYHWDGAIWVEYDGDRILEDDIIDLWGEVKGIKTYEAIFGNYVTIPEVEALHVELVTKAGDR